MAIEEALGIVDALLKPAGLSDVQERVFRQVWAGQSYEEIAEACGYDTSYIRHVGAQLWQLLSKAFGEKVTKGNVHSVVRREAQKKDLSTQSEQSEITDLNIKSQNPCSEVKFSYPYTRLGRCLQACPGK